jgi:hypothetical protein
MKNGKRPVFDRTASIRALKKLEEDRAIRRGYDMAIVASASILWRVHGFHAVDIKRVYEDIRVLEDTLAQETKDGTWEEKARARLSGIREELDIDTLDWSNTQGLSDCEAMGAAIALETVICALHDDDYFVVSNEELKEYYTEFMQRVREYGAGKWNMAYEKRELEREMTGDS